MTKDDLVNKVKAILKGIDEDECNSQDGWWETSEGASFGKTKLAEVVAILEALEQPAQKPVAYEIVRVKLLKDEYGFTYDGWNDIIDSPMKSGTKLYTHPAPSWQGLSDDEIWNIANFLGKNKEWDYPVMFAKTIEQALKEKNT